MVFFAETGLADLCMQSKKSIVIVIHCAPLSVNAVHAWRVCDALCDAGHQVYAFFDQAGVGHANPPAASEPDTMALMDAYMALAADSEGAIKLLVCRAAWDRRYQGGITQPWQLSGLIGLAEYIATADRVLTFS